MQKQDTQKIIETLRHFNETTNEKGFKIVAIFGSYARGTQDTFSDIDLLYEIDHTLFYKDDAFAKLAALESIQKDLEQVFHKKIDLIPVNTKNKHLQNSLQKEKIAV
jgi:predicted nucleotidyltransferase